MSPRFKIGQRVWLPETRTPSWVEPGAVVTIIGVGGEAGAFMYAVRFDGQTDSELGRAWPESWFEEIPSTPLRQFIDAVTAPDV